MMSPPNVVRLVRRVGDLAARDLLLTARVIDTDEALRIGLVSRRADDARADALVLAHQVATLAPLSVSGHKRAVALASADAAPGAEVLAAMGALEAAAFASDDVVEGVAAFTEKRPANFRGR